MFQLFNIYFCHLYNTNHVPCMQCFYLCILFLVLYMNHVYYKNRSSWKVPKSSVCRPQSSSEPLARSQAFAAGDLVVFCAVSSFVLLEIERIEDEIEISRNIMKYLFQTSPAGPHSGRTSWATCQAPAPTNAWAWKVARRLPGSKIMLYFWVFITLEV